jgi:hypothetical protein
MLCRARLGWGCSLRYLEHAAPLRPSAFNSPHRILPTCACTLAKYCMPRVYLQWPPRCRCESVLLVSRKERRELALQSIKSTPHPKERARPERDALPHFGPRKALVSEEYCAIVKLVADDTAKRLVDNAHR